MIVPTSQEKGIQGRYTLSKPADGWFKDGFDDAKWKEAPGGFGTKGTPGAVIGTNWNTADIWLRREITVPGGDFANLQFLVYHDEDVEINVDGLLAAREGGYINSYEPLEMSKTAAALLKPGAKVMLAVHCHQTEGGQGVDVGIVNVEAGK